MLLEHPLINSLLFRSIEIEVEYINKILKAACSKDEYERLPRRPTCIQLGLEFVFIVFALSLVPWCLYFLEYSVDTNMDSYFGNMSQKSNADCFKS